jgi:hypothetical protein
MSHCVFTAYEDCLFHTFGIKATRSDFNVYLSLKWLAQGRENVHNYTRDEYVPFIIGGLAKIRRLGMDVQHRIGPDFHIHNKQFPLTPLQKVIVRSSNWGKQVKKITIAPAIYCSPLESHASYALFPVYGANIGIRLYISDFWRTP